MSAWIEGLPAALEVFLLVCAASATAWGLWKGVYRPLKGHFDRVNAGMDTLLGYPPVLDPGSGRELQPATPPLAQRVYDLEQTNERLVTALETLAQNQQDIVHLQKEMDERKRLGDQVIADFTLWREKVDRALERWVGEQDELATIIREKAEEPT